MAVPVTVAFDRVYRQQREEPVEDPVERGQVAAVLHQRHRERGAQRLTPVQDAGLRRGGHRVQRLGDGDPYSGEPKQPDEPVHGTLHAGYLFLSWPRRPRLRFAANDLPPWPVPTPGRRTAPAATVGLP